MLYDLVDMTKWRTKKDIIEELKNNGMPLDERAFRKIVENHNKLYFEHQNEYYIAHSSKGYRATKDEVEIRASAYDYKKRGIDQLIKYSKSMKALGENLNFKFEIVNDEMIYVELEGEQNNAKVY